MAINDVDTSEPWVTGFAFVVLTVAVPFEGVVLLGVHILSVNEPLPATVAAAGVILALWWSDDR